MGSKDDTMQLSVPDRMAGLAKAKASAETLKADERWSFQPGRDHSVTAEEARSTINDWPAAPKDVAEKLLDHYGPPNEATRTTLFWYATGPWSRMEVTADQVVHDFPTPHTDFLSQYVHWPIDPDRGGDLVRFDGSVLVDRTSGEVGARCDDEAMNILTLNLAVEILDGRRTVDEAREVYAETASAYMMGRDAPYAERLQFTPPSQPTNDPDESTIAHAMADQMVEKVKDLLGEGGETPR